MDKNQVIAFLKQNKDYLHQQYGVKAIGLFGSFAREGATGESDIDILVELDTPRFGYWAGLKAYLEKNLGREIDLVRKGKHLRGSFLQTIEKEIIYV